MIIEPSARGASEVRRLWLEALRVRECGDAFVSALAAHRTRKANPECMENKESKGDLE